MNYRYQALILGFLFLVAGAFVLVYVAAQAETFTSPVAGGLVVFTGFGLLLIGALVMFASPSNLVAAEILGRVLSPSAENLALIVNGLSPKTRAIHEPNLSLGAPSQVILVLTTETEATIKPSKNLETARELEWSRTSKVLEPMGFELMKGYEEVLNRDFFGLDTQQLARLLNKAVGPELQLASGFSMRELSPDKVEAIWTKPTVTHTCLTNEKGALPELCCLCSSVACALAKASGKRVWTEESKQTNDNLTVVTRYRLLGA